MIVEFDGEIFRWDVRTDSWFFTALPVDLSEQIREIPRPFRGFGSVRVRARIGDYEWRTSIFPDASHEEMEWFNEVQRVTTSGSNAERLQVAFGGIDVRELLAQVRVPTIVLHARDDAVVPFAAGRALAAGIPGAEFVALEGRNHLLLEHEPAWPKLLERIREFLA